MPGYMLFMGAGLTLAYYMLNSFLVTSPVFRVSYILLSILAIGMFLI